MKSHVILTTFLAEYACLLKSGTTPTSAKQTLAKLYELDILDVQYMIAFKEIPQHMKPPEPKVIPDMHTDIPARDKRNWIRGHVYARPDMQMAAKIRLRYRALMTKLRRQDIRDAKGQAYQSLAEEFNLRVSTVTAIVKYKLLDPLEDGV